jgi:putative permease
MKKGLFYYFYPLFWVGSLFLFALALHEALFPLVAAFFLAYLLYPVVTKLQEFKISEQVAIGITFTCSLALLVGIGALLLPKAIQFILSFVHNFPNLMEQFLRTVDTLSVKLGLPIEFKVDSIISDIHDSLHKISFSTVTSLTIFFKNRAINLMGVFVWLIKLFIFPVFFYYALSRLVAAKNEFKSFFPTRYRYMLYEFSAISNRVLSGYIRGQLVVCCILAIFYSSLFWFVGMPFGLIIGVVTGFSFLVPYVGFGISLLLGIVISLADYSSLSQFLIIVFIYLAGQWLESFILTPKITGNRVGLDPFLTILVLIIGGNLFGFVGLLTAIPIAAILKEYYTRLKSHYHTTDFYIR